MNRLEHATFGLMVSQQVPLREFNEEQAEAF